ncbi:MAG TPA: hypothetical protein VEQ60_21140 [Longimicrobium sp.]|nr:hypothetical protein [Longimicrobium sp.]
MPTLARKSVRRPLNRIREVRLPFDPSVYANLKAELDRNRARRLTAGKAGKRDLQSA